MLALHALAVGQASSAMSDAVAFLVSSCRSQATNFASATYSSAIMNGMCATHMHMYMDMYMSY